MDTWVENTRAGQHQRIHAHSMFLLLAAFVALAPPCAAPMASPTCPELKRAAGAVSHLLAEGNAALETGDIAKAQTSWKTIRECAPANQDWPKAVFNLGLLEYKGDNLRQATEQRERDRPGQCALCDGGPGTFSGDGRR
jgi:outer membrane protein assembly factor BamD (BamD/ComL family)